MLSQDIPHIFALTLFEDFIYWTDWETKSINRAHKTTGANKTLLISTLHRPMDIHIYHPYRQPDGERGPGGTVLGSHPGKGTWGDARLGRGSRSRVTRVLPLPRRPEGPLTRRCPPALPSSRPSLQDQQRRLQQPLPALAGRGAQVCLSHQLLPGQRRQNLRVQLHSQPDVKQLRKANRSVVMSQTTLWLLLLHSSVSEHKEDDD